MTETLEIPKTNPPKHIKRKTIHLYGITGWFIKKVSAKEKEVAMAFSGYFKHDPSTNKILVGQIVDPYGSSTILNGEMNSNVLKFVKSYDAPGKISDRYNFEKKNGVWIGEFKEIYDWDTLRKINKVKALTTLIEDDSFDIACGLIYSPFDKPF